MYKHFALIALFATTACSSSQAADTAAATDNQPVVDAKNVKPAGYDATTADGDQSCAGKKEQAVKKAQFTYAKLTVTQLKNKLASGDAVPVDANGDETRKDKGVIPGAILLAGYSDYKVSQLPDDKSKELVFYCANEHCSASKRAAETAFDAGHKKISVLPAGIFGWVKAGEKVSKDLQQI
jgi:rhodanese-related sulfurtransferase